MKPTKYHLTIWARRNAPGWVAKIEVPKARTWAAKALEARLNPEIHHIINERVGIKSIDFYRVANAINLYTLAKHNARYAGKVFSLSEYLKEMYDQKEYSIYFKRWIRKINNCQA